ncbi:MAG TPA: PilZ domain-containing protein [Tepidisphaeraceae bacterium]|jgi:hypothetical protein
MRNDVKGSESSVADRRTAPRFPHQSTAQLVLCPASRRKGRVNVRVEDYSVHGIGATHDEPLPLGQKYIVIEPYVTRGGSTIYTVVRCNEMPDGRYSIGLQMVRTVRDPVEQMMDEIVPLEDESATKHGWIKRVFAHLFSNQTGGRA